MGCPGAALCTQVSAYGSDNMSDGQDVWTIDWSGKAQHWVQDAQVGGNYCSCGPQGLQPMRATATLHGHSRASSWWSAPLACSACLLATSHEKHGDTSPAANGTAASMHRPACR